MSPLHKLQNSILCRLPDEEAEIAIPFMEAIHLPTGLEISVADQPIKYVYFLEEGIGSVLAVSPEGHKAEAGMFGKEGFAPTYPSAGIAVSPHDVVIQSDGHGHRIRSVMLWKLMEQCPVFQGLLFKSCLNLATQVSFTALSNAIHSIDERLARWLLMCHDRVTGDELCLTHEYISLMLAVRRPSVTTSLHVLEGNHFIRSERKRIIVTDRKAMEEFAQNAYGRPELEHRQLFRPVQGPGHRV